METCGAHERGRGEEQSVGRDGERVGREFRRGLYISKSKRLTYSHILFFQAEDGIRDESVTGVQTCALPISRRSSDLRDESVTGVQTCALPILNSSHTLISYAVFC